MAGPVHQAVAVQVEDSKRAAGWGASTGGQAAARQRQLTQVDKRRQYGGQLMPCHAVGGRVSMYVYKV